MLIKQIIEVFDLLDSPMPAGEEVKAYLQGGEDDITVKTIRRKIRHGFYQNRHRRKEWKA